LLLANGIQNISRPGDIREVDFGLDLIRTAGTRRFGNSLGFTRGRAKMSAHFLRFVVLERTGVRFLLGDPDFVKNIENRFAFNFQFPGQIVDSNLAHPPLFPPDFPA
jgi:hypothetical protein